MIWRWRRRRELQEAQEGQEAVEAERRADRQRRRALLQGKRVDRAVGDAEDARRTMDQLAREFDRAMRPRGV